MTPTTWATSITCVALRNPCDARHHQMRATLGQPAGITTAESRVVYDNWPAVKRKSAARPSTMKHQQQEKALHNEDQAKSPPLPNQRRELTPPNLTSRKLSPRCEWVVEIWCDHAQVPGSNLQLIGDDREVETQTCTEKRQTKRDRARGLIMAVFPSSVHSLHERTGARYQTRCSWQNRHTVGRGWASVPRPRQGDLTGSWLG